VSTCGVQAFLPRVIHRPQPPSLAEIDPLPGFDAICGHFCGSTPQIVPEKKAQSCDRRRQWQPNRPGVTIPVVSGPETFRGG
jgi:hypothetical protein